MANLNPVTTAIKGYVDESKEELLTKSVLGGNTINKFSLMTGVKGATTIKLLDSEITLQDGTECGFNATGSDTISKRTITPAILKVNKEWCDKNFLDTYAAHMVKLAAGTEVLPYEQKFIQENIKKINAANEKMIFQGDTANGAECDGLIKILTNDGAISFTKGATVWKSLKNAYAAIPEAVLANENVEMLISPADYRTFVQELVSANMYHYNANDGADSLTLPGTEIKISKVNGLAGTHKVIAGNMDNIVAGVDLANDDEKFEFWYSQDDRVFRLAVEYAIGVQVAFPADVVMGDLV